MQRSFERFFRWYRDTAVTLLTTLILLLVFTAFSYLFYAFRDYQKPVIPSELLQPRAMHRMSPEQAREFFKEFDRMGERETYIYQPWVGFSHRVYHSERLNVDAAVPMPVRRTVQGTSRPGGRPLTVWLFGGSTAFGWGVPDDETVASHLSALLSRRFPDRAVTVTNHAHSWYYSSQEVVQFQTLLRRGGHCDVAVFLDGLNDWGWYSSRDVPAFTDEVAKAMEREQMRNPTALTYFWLSPEFPPLRLLRNTGRRILRRPGPPVVDHPMFDEVAKYRVNLATAADLGRAHRIKTLFFWQPVPYIGRYAGAVKLAERVRREIRADRFFFIADLFKGIEHDEVYVDGHHYGDTANERVAQTLAREIAASVVR